MPDIAAANAPLTVLPNLFVSPFGNDETVPMYSSIPVSSSLATGCLPCVVCGVGAQNLSRVLTEITQLASLAATGSLQGGSSLAGAIVSPGGSFFDPSTIPLTDCSSAAPPPTPPDPPDPPVPPPLCDLCGSHTVDQWMAANGFPTAESGSLPYSLDGSSVAGTLIYGDITSDGSSFGRAGGGSLGPPLIFDNAIIVFPLILREFTISYEYMISAGGKHWAQLMADSLDPSSAIVAFGSWSDNFSNTIGTLLAGSSQSQSTCQNFSPPAELAGLLPQSSGVWRTRTMVKSGNTITMTDGNVGPIAVTRCFVDALGHVSMNLGPGVRIRNLVIS